MISTSMIARYLQECGISEERIEKIVTRVKNFDARNFILSENDLIVLLGDLAYPLIFALEGNDLSTDLSKNIFPIRGDVTFLKKMWSEKRSGLARLFGGDVQIVVIAKQVPNDYYPPQSAEKVEIDIFEDGIRIYSTIVVTGSMSISYSALVLAVSTHVKTLSKIRKRRVRNVLNKFCDHYFSASDLVVASSLEKRYYRVLK